MKRLATILLALGLALGFCALIAPPRPARATDPNAYAPLSGATVDQHINKTTGALLVEDAGASVENAYRITITGTSKLLWGPDANLTCPGGPATLPDNLRRLSIAAEVNSAGAIADNIRFNLAGAATAATEQFQPGGTVLNIRAAVARTTQVISEGGGTLYATMYVSYPK